MPSTSSVRDPPREAPRITVVVTAFGRHRYLRCAVDSVLEQASRSLPIQTVVVKDFVDGSLDRYLAAAGVVQVTPTGSRLGGWIEQAISAASAPVVAFLDDDDLFVPGKLAAIDRAFRDHPDAGFFRNSIQPFRDGADREAPAAPTTTSALRVVADDAKDRRAVEDLWSDGVAFNHSTMAVPRGLLEQLRPELGRLVDGYSALLFYAALVSSRAILVDLNPWTRYRLHPGNESPIAPAPRRVKWARIYREALPRTTDARMILEMVRKHRPKIWVGPLERAIARNEMFLTWSDPERTRAHRARAWLSLIRMESLRTLWGDAGNLGIGGVAWLSRDWTPGAPPEISRRTRPEEEVRSPIDEPR